MSYDDEYLDYGPRHVATREVVPPPSDVDFAGPPKKRRTKKAEPTPIDELRDRTVERQKNRKTHPPMASPFSTKVVGVTFHLDYPHGLNAIRTKMDEPFEDRGTVWATLRREPCNPVDPNAVAVHVARFGKVGHLTRAAAMRLSPELDCSTRWLARVWKVDGPEADPGIHIRCLRTEPPRRKPRTYKVGKRRRRDQRRRAGMKA